MVNRILALLAWLFVLALADDTVQCPNHLQCDEFASCIKTQTGFACQCNDGFHGSGQTCEDVNECELNDICAKLKNMVCINKPGTFRCVCKEGYRLNGDTYQCTDIDECKILHGPHAHKCLVEKACENYDGGYRCRCHYLGDGIKQISETQCGDIDECKMRIGPHAHKCLVQKACENIVGGYRCKCYILGDNIKQISESQCEDRDQCPDTLQCDEFASCIKTQTGFACQCNDGFHGSGQTCADVNECELNDICANLKNMVCINKPGTFNCICKEGYRLNDDTYQCTDVNECELNDVCANFKNTVCINKPGTFNCICKEGYRLNDDTQKCTDLNECELNDICANFQNTVCLNKPGTFNCVCKVGYRLNNDTQKCTDVNECELNDRCANFQNTVCFNKPGTFKCVCKEGYRLNNNTQKCTDVNECELNDICANFKNTVCLNKPGTFNCICIAGYRLNADTQKCTDIDECKIRDGPHAHKCLVEKACENDIGGYRCRCSVFGDGIKQISETQCEDVNECQLNDICVNFQNMVCINKVGTFNCVCKEGYRLNADTYQCTDINECEIRDGSHAHKCLVKEACQNYAGGYRCRCSVLGYGIKQVSENQCEDINECEIREGLLSHKCLVKKACQNDDGGYKCKCPVIGEGLWLEQISTIQCKDTDQCPDTLQCDEFASCIKTQIGFACQCNDGFHGNGQTCEDVNECELNDICGKLKNTACINKPGTFSCVCKQGYRLNDATYECTDINECEMGVWPRRENCLVKEACQNYAGGYRCRCSIYGDAMKQISETQCKDTNECKEKNGESALHKCNEESRCLNSAGSYTCNCYDKGHTCQEQCEKCGQNTHCSYEEGYRGCFCRGGQADKCYDKRKCVVNVSMSAACSANHTCFITSCYCKLHFENLRLYGSKYECEDIDECHPVNYYRQRNKCGPGSYCVNTIGDFRCECDVGCERISLALCECPFSTNPKIYWSVIDCTRHCSSWIKSLLSTLDCRNAMELRYCISEAFGRRCLWKLEIAMRFQRLKQMKGFIYLYTKVKDICGFSLVADTKVSEPSVRRILADDLCATVAKQRCVWNR